VSPGNKEGGVMGAMIFKFWFGEVIIFAPYKQANSN